MDAVLQGNRQSFRLGIAPVLKEASISEWQQVN